MNLSPGDDTSDEALMLAYARGEAAAFETLYARHRAALFRYLRRLVREPALVEDVYQDVWMRVINARERYVDTARFTTWLYTIAHNRVMDHHRAARLREAGRLGHEAEEDEDPLERLPDTTTPLPEQLLEREQLLRRVLAAVDALPAPQREAFVLQQEGGLSLEAIATATGVNAETAKSRLRYAFAKLRRELGGRP